MKIDVVICGVGGQGVLLASEVLANMALSLGLDVKKSEIHGMAQRGGSVFSHVRIGEKVHSPVIPLGTADFMLAFEELEALRYAPYLKPEAVVLVNRQRIMPMTVLSGLKEYPEDTINRLKEHFKVYQIEAIKLAQQAGNPRTTNMVMLGALSELLPWEEEQWMKALENSIPPKLLNLNIKAFKSGRQTIRNSPFQP